MKKLAILDLDGTLIDSRKDRFADGRLEFVQTLRKERYDITIATGRSFESAWKFAELLNIELPIVVLDGALIKDGKGRVYLSKRIDRDEFQLIREIFEKHCKFVYFLEKHSVVHTHTLEYATIVLHWKLRYSIVTKDLYEPPLKAIYMNEDYAYLLSLVRELEGIRGGRKGFYFYPSMKRKGLYIVDITAISVDKSSSLEIFRGMGYEYILAIGDYINDLPLLMKSDRGILVNPKLNVGDTVERVSSFEELKSIFT